MNSKYALGAVALTSTLIPMTEVMAGEMFHEVQKGDTFSSIVEKISVEHPDLNYKEVFSLIKDINKERFDNLNVIFPGDKILLPTEKQIAAVIEKTTPKQFMTADGKSVVERYRVQKGDTLSEIARKHIKWSDVYSSKGTLNYLIQYNPHITDVNHIVEDQVVNIPLPSEVAKNYNMTAPMNRLPSSDPTGPEFEEDYREDALNPDFSFDGLRFHNMPDRKSTRLNSSH